MTISFKCSSCGKAYEVGNELAGKKGIAILMILYMIAYASLTTMFYSKTMHSIRRCVR
ncbi:MAG: hypothetical protein MKZ94_09145 [Pirellulales bacterium]|nr:hypothetical protein [Pirellulales bacterium]